ncbi:MAG: hypothetical protein KME45_22090 [Stenomitos rutilans HA7619-LM2]|jgi:hypothetical protein|nr:hypothetical protein [Stenomitos rutilans HA7619-LM2]
METSLVSPLQFCLKQILPFAFSFLDDALLLLLPRLGLHVDGLHWLSPVLFSGTLLYWLGQFCYCHYRTSLVH